MAGVVLINKIIKALRYRFFIFAGIFPYLMGQILAFHSDRYLHWQNFWWGFLGIGLVLMGVEIFNEYFDARSGGDRIFLQEKFVVPDYFFYLGIFAFGLAFLIGLYLSFRVGWPILLLSFLGFLAAYFYVAPPIRWAYRGLGELVIALSYGPFMVLGSFYLQTKRFDALCSWVSLILGLLLFSLALVNEIPDYYQDRLVGKKNIVVRLGRKTSTKLFSLTLLSVFILLGLGIAFKIIPFSSIACFLWLPLVLKSIKIAKSHYDSPFFFLPAIQLTLFTYIVIISFLSIGYLGG